MCEGGRFAWKQLMATSMRCLLNVTSAVVVRSIEGSAAGERANYGRRRDLCHAPSFLLLPHRLGQYLVGWTLAVQASKASMA